MPDFNKTLDLIKNGLLEPRATWQSYAAENRSWQDTAMLLTAPLILGSFILAGLLSLIFGSRGAFGAGAGFGGWIVGLVMAFVGVAVASFIFSYLAGLFKGRHDFNRGLAALSLAAIPGYLGNIIGVVPFIGWLVSLALGIVSLVFLYKIIPLYLDVPQEKRVLHFIASLVACFIVMLILGAVLGAGGMMDSRSAASLTDQQSSQTGMLGGIERYARLMEQAGEQEYEPPADGKISEQQMARYMEVMRKAAEVRGEQMADVERLGEEYKDKEPGISDLVKMSGGVGSVLGAFNAEMEVVMTGDGNWAEHQWIKEQLRVARIQKDLNEAVEHNYQLYQAHREELEKLSAAH
ncbi:MAG TPA: Yip1 family protein [Arenicellales bacterium]|nr:Yip1 family protein [Arenicellales bacterium]